VSVYVNFLYVDKSPLSHMNPHNVLCRAHYVVNISGQWTLSATNWQLSSVKLCWQHLQWSKCCGKKISKLRIWDKVPDGSTHIFGDTW